jgi:hypothetical protein
VYWVTVQHLQFFTFTLPCIVTDFFLNNQPEAQIIQILFCYKILHVSGNPFAHHAGFWWPLPSRVRMELRCPKHVEFYNRTKFG